jgi:hypothetical protein
MAAGSHHETFHFVLNNAVVKDNRIPPYGMSYDEARKRNALPVPADQYGNPGAGGTYEYWDQIELNPPAEAVYATIDLLYQPTSWEYIQFLYLANTGQNLFLGNEGAYLLEAWLATDMAAPYVMVSTTWGSAPTPPTPDVIVDSLATWSVGKGGVLVAQSDTFKTGDTVAVLAHTVDQDGAAVSGSQVFLEVRDASGDLVTPLQGFSDASGDAVLKWKIPRRQAAGSYTGQLVEVINSGYEYNAESSVTTVVFVIQ